jgi:exodeoxyribonuclease V alpha subunit
VSPLDAFDARRALRATGALRAFNDAEVLLPAEVHVARRLAELAGESDEQVALAVALAVRAPRLGHVYADLAAIRETASVDAEEPVDLAALPWPEVEPWLARVAASPLTAVGDDGPADRPLRLEGSALYLDRYWREERQVAADLTALRERPPAAIDEAVLAAGLERIFGGADGDALQRRAAETALRRRFTVIAGGPGTGKTTTVARILALLLEQPGPEPLIALAAPTGKAAARLVEAIRDAAGDLDIADDVRGRLTALDASTLHRLLGWRPGSNSRFRHDRRTRLPHDVVIVDESSMVSLWMTARLLEAVRPDARLVLVGDPGQLASVEAGAVLGDVVGAAPPGSGIVVLERVHRYGERIARVASAIEQGDGDAAVAALHGVTWIEADVGDSEQLGALAPVRGRAVATARAVIAAARAGDGTAALAALGGFRLLCAHRRGPYGVRTWTARIESWLADAVEGFAGAGEWYPGRPLLVTENDEGLRLYNGDSGVVVATSPGRVTAAFERHGRLLELSPQRLGAIDTVYAMTVHKSQGSQFGTAAVVLPGPDSPILTRELLYTAVTRAQEDLIVVGTEAAVRAAVARPISRASALRQRLWATR